MHPSRPIIVAGAGVGGLTAALALARHGLPVEVYERRTAEEIRTAPGSGLTLWSNASTPLGWLGLGERLLDAAERVVEIRNFDSRGRVRFTMRTHPYIWPDALPSLSIGRMDLAAILLAACAERGVPVHHGRRVTGYRQSGDGVEVLLDGGTATGGALIGADGVRSSVLTQLRGEVPGIYLGRTTYRGVCAGTAGLVPEVPLLFHDEQTRIGGGVYPIGGDRAAWTLSWKAPAGEREQPGREHEHAVRLARVLPAVLRDRVARTPAEAIIRTDIWYHEWHEDWGDGVVTLLGDAAHAMPNDLGQGACQAVEDAVVLADALAAGDLSGPAGVAAALRAYERRRYERVRWVRQQSVQVATAAEPRSALARWLMGKLTRLYLALAEKKMWQQMQQPPELTTHPTRVGS
ncbi:2-polyprenyl-6-methoxyphenol hydroxylase [Micromonospora viridifaciens]|uniref:2-polyprenyl-6-methoxyphenol hydroxylase n=1 Tax=Micromonospora viridifaciens TaxID=1881 RepID=A0A1C4WUV4_MICVI|nr:NAD(P)/FAD-dependent oxidoreductase [Micromonospora viridifaciens]SCE99934.1 2-polyprenyl-6-methoxyphenol hydroxylase [Micromonospora viridifaciens]